MLCQGVQDQEKDKQGGQGLQRAYEQGAQEAEEGGAGQEEAQDSAQDQADQNTFDQAGLAGSLGAETEQVVPFGLDVDTEFNGTQGTVLSQCRKPLFQLCGCRKLELVRVAFFV